MTYQPRNYFRQGDQALVLGGNIVDGADVALPIARQLYFAQLTTTGLNSTGGGAIGALANPAGVPIILFHPFWDITAASAGAATADVGVAANGTTSADNLFDALTLNGSITGAYAAGSGTNGRAVRRMSASEFITVTGSANSASLAGTLYVPFYIL